MTDKIKWIPTDERLPDASGNVLTRTEYSCMEPWIALVHYSARHKAFNVSDRDEHPRTEIKVTAWAYAQSEKQGRGGE